MVCNERHGGDLAALERAAKFICLLKCGLCPIREPDFSGCPHECTEDVRPWQCWIHYFRNVIAGEGN